MDPNSSQRITMDLEGRSSTFVLGPLACLELDAFMSAPPAVFVVDAAVARLHPSWLEQIIEGCRQPDGETLILEGGEDVKTLARLAEIYAWLADHQVPRDGTVVGVGGGTILDLVGLASSTWRRGVNFVAIPTTLLAMVDAAIGGKTAVNTAGLKNTVGTFHPASGILCDPGFLATLPRGCWRDGMAELIKTALVGDERLFTELHRSIPRLVALFGDRQDDQPVHGILGALPWRRWIGRAAAVKAGIVNRDFREGSLRRSLNLGHTLGHVLEAHSLKTATPLTHGKAVAVGLAVVFRIAAERGTCPLPTAVQVLELLEACGLPVSYPAPPVEDLATLLAADKKTSAVSGLRWVLPRDVARLDLDARVDLREILKWLDPA